MSAGMIPWLTVARCLTKQPLPGDRAAPEIPMGCTFTGEMLMRISVLTLVLAVLTATAADRRTVTPATMISWKIVCDSSATQSERYAATEFQRLFKEMTGAMLPLAETANAGSGAVFIGPEAVARSGQPLDRRALGEEALRIRVAPNAVCIDGGRPRGTIYGVYEFFEELCGVRFLTFDHTYYPEGAAARKIRLGVRMVDPTFAFRWSYYGETSRYPDFAARLRVNTVSDDPKLGGERAFVWSTTTSPTSCRRRSSAKRTRSITRSSAAGASWRRAAAARNCA